MPITVGQCKTKSMSITNATTLATLTRLYGIKKLPLAPMEASIDISGISTTAINSLRRVIAGETPGYRLTADKVDTNAKYAFDEFVLRRIQFVRLARLISDDDIKTIKFELDMVNGTATPMKVYIGDLKIVEGKLSSPIFNPTTLIVTLEPGAHITIKNIHIEKGYGRDNDSFAITCLGRFTHLDIPQYSEEDIKSGPAMEYSGYKQSCLVANPQAHKLTFMIPASSGNKSEALWILVDGCDNIISRFRVIANIMTQIEEKQSSNVMGISYTETTTSSITVGTLIIPNETHTVGEILRRTIYDEHPNVSNLSLSIDNYINTMSLKVGHTTESVIKLILSAVRRIIQTFEEIRQPIYAMLN